MLIACSFNVVVGVVYVLAPITLPLELIMFSKESFPRIRCVRLPLQLCLCQGRTYSTYAARESYG